MAGPRVDLEIREYGKFQDTDEGRSVDTFPLGLDTSAGPRLFRFPFECVRLFTLGTLTCQF